MCIEKLCLLLFNQTYVVGAQKNQLNETILLLSTHNKCLKHMLWVLIETVLLSTKTNVKTDG